MAELPAVAGEDVALELHVDHTVFVLQIDHLGRAMPPGIVFVQRIPPEVGEVPNLQFPVFCSWPRLCAKCPFLLFQQPCLREGSAGLSL